MTERVQPPIAEPRGPGLAPPPGAVDCHAHVFAPEGVLPYAERRPYTPAAGVDLAAYTNMHEAIGIDRGVLVHSNIYGPDNRVSVDALVRAWPRLRGICLLHPDASRGELARLAGCGMCGLRINLEFPGEMTQADVEAMAARLAAVGWHLQILAAAPKLAEMADRLARLPIDVVVDHMALMRPEYGLNEPGFVSLLHLLATGKVWVKLSAPYFADSGPPWKWAHKVARALIKARPDRMLWGTNWPHPLADPIPDDGALVDWINLAAGEDAIRRAIFVDNPVKLYGF
ncbi:MAG: amidohydrolase family protein [Proteobacteria bacterium]|nr:amidohydrolase family protein [Pseudomonadota bacterium]MBI3497230.1 amidohydrolase family protein [Pseudomonadota bacterium]